MESTGLTCGVCVWMGGVLQVQSLMAELRGKEMRRALGIRVESDGDGEREETEAVGEPDEGDEAML